MFKSLIFAVFLIFVGINCINVKNKEETEFEFELEDDTVITQQTPIAPVEEKAALNEVSSVVNNDGSFKFVNHANGLRIEIEGHLKDVNGTKTLVFEGMYEFKDISWWFEADESGFALKEPPVGIPNRVIASIVG